MLLVAYVKDKQTKKTELITRDNYRSKEAFWRDLEANGYTVIRISNNRDRVAQEYNFVTFAAMKKWDELTMRRFGFESEFHKIIEQINKIEL